MEVPLIYTTKGNIPVDDLEYSTNWQEDDNCIVFQETYKLDGEVVKQGAHVYLKRGLSFESETAKL